MAQEENRHRTSQRSGQKRRRPSSTAQRRTSGGRRPASRTSSPRSRRRTAPLRMPLGNSVGRLRLAALMTAFVVTLCAGRLLQLQGLDAPAYAATAAKQMTRTINVPAVRGTITDRNGAVLAMTSPAVMITCDPTLINPQHEVDPKSGKKVTNKVDQVADLLMKHVGGDREAYVRALTKENTHYSVVARKVPAAAYQRLADELSKEKIYGVFRESDPVRSYPEGHTAASLIGFVGADEDAEGITSVKGQGGIEFSMNKQLAGAPGKEVFEASPAGYRIPLGSNVVTPATDGISYELTIDSELQQTAERRLAEMVEESKAEWGSTVVMNVKTGEVLAMANVPTFDPNNVAAATPDDMYNRSITQAFEPGSVQKVLTMAALVDEGLITPDTRLVVPPSLESGGGKIKDVWAHGYAQATARGVMAYSSNIGTIMMARQMDTAKFHEYMENFGLNRPTGIELPGEASGSLPPADMKGPVRDQIAFGQGLSVTPLQNAAAVAAIANGGVYNRPTVIKSAKDANGNPIELPARESRRVVKESTSKEVVSMMESVVGPGAFAQNMAMDDYRIAGKTGTSENFNVKTGKYDSFTSSFMMVAPAEDPQILTYTVIVNPKNGHTGGAVAGPVAWDLTRMALPRYGVQPSTSRGPGKEALTWE